MIAFTDKSKPLQRCVVRAMGRGSAHGGLSIALNLDMEVVTDPVAPRARIAEVARELVALRAEAVILGCAGMAHHRAAAEDACGVPVIEPSQAAGGAGDSGGGGRARVILGCLVAQRWVTKPQ